MAEKAIVDDDIDRAIQNIKSSCLRRKRCDSDDELNSASDGNSSNVSEYMEPSDDEFNTDSDDSYDVSEFVETEMCEETSQGSQPLTETHELNTFWPKVTEEIRNLRQTDLHQQELPLDSVKCIMKLDEEKMLSEEAPVLFSKAIEIFITELTLRAWIHTEDSTRRTLQRSDIAMAVAKCDQFDFLIDIVPREEHHFQIAPQSQNYQQPQQQQQQQQQVTRGIQTFPSSPSLSPSMKPIFYNGRAFTSYEDICAAKEMYEKQSQINLVKNSCQRIREDTHRNTENANQELLYSEISYSCMYGVDYKERKTSSELDKASELNTYNEKKKRKSSSYKCPFKMDLYLSKDGQTLVVSNLQEEHNHIYHSSINDQLPQERRLDVETLEETKMLLALNVDKKVLQQHLYSKGKTVTTKDLHHLRKCIKREVILTPDQHRLTMAEKRNSSTVSQHKADNIDLIFDYVINKKYASGMSKNDKANLRRLSKNYVARTGQLYYRHRAKKFGNSGNEFREVLIIRDRDKQRHIIERMHMGSRDSDATYSLRSHPGIERTRGKILERFYWKNVGRDVREFILACDHCQSHRINPVHKTGVSELHSVPLPSEVKGQIEVDITSFPKTECVSQNKADEVDLILKADQNILKVAEECNSSTVSQDKADNIDLILKSDQNMLTVAEECNSSTVSKDKADNIDLILKADHHILTMAEECNSTTVSQDKPDNIDLIFEYVVNKKYASGMSRRDKGNIRRLSRPYIARTGQLYYLHRPKRIGNSSNEYREVLVIRDRDVQRHIVKSIHMGSGDSDTARCLGSHLGIDRTRAKILERFYWKNVGRDVREFILACERCQNVNAVRKINPPSVDVAYMHHVHGCKSLD